MRMHYLSILSQEPWFGGFGRSVYYTTKALPPSGLKSSFPSLSLSLSLCLCLCLCLSPSLPSSLSARWLAARGFSEQPIRDKSIGPTVGNTAGTYGGFYGYGNGKGGPI